MHRICFLILLLALTLPACDSAEDDAGVRIVRYDGPPIEQNNVSDAWQGRVEEVLTGTRVILTAASRRDSLILFYEPDPSIPVEGTLYYRGSDQTYVLYDGTIAIQDWEIDGIVSGQFEGELRGLQSPRAGVGARTDGVFWVDLSEQP
jgi:hypothetical protein